MRIRILHVFGDAKRIVDLPVQNADGSWEYRCSEIVDYDGDEDGFHALRCGRPATSIEVAGDDEGRCVDHAPGWLP